MILITNGVSDFAARRNPVAGQILNGDDQPWRGRGRRGDRRRGGGRWRRGRGRMVDGALVLVFAKQTGGDKDIVPAETIHRDRAHAVDRGW